jgi:DnaJ-class molecular chaperone
MVTKCPACHGRGKFLGIACSKCHGLGVILYKKARGYGTNYPPPWDKNANGIPDWRERGYGGVDNNPNTPW